MSGNPDDSTLLAQLRDASTGRTEAWNRLLAAADDFEGRPPDQDDYRWSPVRESPDGVLTSAYPIYSERVRLATSALAEVGAVTPAYDWMQLPPVDVPADGALSPADAMRIATAIVRGERFGDGTIGEAVMDGTLQAVLAALAAWYRRKPQYGREQVLGLLLGGAVGDALGAPVEFLSLQSIRGQFGPAGISDFAPAYGPDGGKVTDDTQMALFTMEGLLRALERERLGGGDASPVAMSLTAYYGWLRTQGLSAPAAFEDGLINRWVLHAQRAPGSTCLSALRASAAGGPMGTTGRPINNSKGCGGVMRVAPVGLWPAGGPADTFRLAADVAALTHGHPSGYLSAGTFAVIVRELLRGNDLWRSVAAARAELVNWPDHAEQLAVLDKAVALAGDRRPTPEDIERELGGGWVGEEALAIGLCAALAARDFADGVALAVNHSGDSDSTGAIAGHILGAMLGVQAIPDTWLTGLEPGVRDLIEDLTADLFTELSANEHDRDRSWRTRERG